MKYCLRSAIRRLNTETVSYTHLFWKNIVNILSDSLLENYEVATAINEV